MKKLLFFFTVFIGTIGTANAQWHFSITSMNYDDICSGNAPIVQAEIEVAIRMQLANDLASKTYTTKEECESMRSIATMNWSSGGCYIRTTTSPCTGGNIGGGSMGGAGSSGTADILASSQGHSFYTTNPANEIKNWSSDDIERHLALDQKFQTTRPEAIVTTDAKYNEERATARENSTWYVDPDKSFVPVTLREGGSSTVRLDGFSMRDKIDNAQEIKTPANQANVQQYVNASTFSAQSYLDNPQDLTQWLHDEFKKVSGYDLDSIMQILPHERSEAGKQALTDYHEYRKQVMDAMIKEIDEKAEEVSKELDMAILSEDSYKYSDHNHIDQTNYKKVTTDFFEDGSAMKKLSNIIDWCNSTNIATGFHADLYYNNVTNEYTISFEGSNVELKKSLNETLESFSAQPLYDFVNDWFTTNAVQGTGGIPQQYLLAAIIGQNLPENVKINITGHSLGGGLASVAGAISSKPTYTFNAEGVNTDIIQALGITKIIEKQEYNIRAIRSADDPLTSLQEGEMRIEVVGTVLGTIIVADNIIPEKVREMEVVKQTYNKIINGTMAIASGNKVGASAIGEKKTYNTGGGHGIDGFINHLAVAQKTYSLIKNDLYKHGHGVEEQTQDRINIKIGN
jgi:hypothetical protein